VRKNFHGEFSLIYSRIPRLTASLFGLALLFSVTAVQGDILVQGHRGARAAMPENTLAAFKYALEIGVDVLELDLGVSSDDVLVIAHDPVVSERCLIDGKPPAKPIPLRTLSLAQIKAFDCGSVRHPLFPDQQLQPGEKIPTLDEFFEMIASADTPASRRVTFNIETKIFPPRPDLTPTPEAFSRLLVESIRAHGLVNRVVVQSFDYRTLKWVKELDPKISTSQLTQQNFVDLVAAAKSIGADYISPDWKSITVDMVQDFQAQGLKVAPWTANSIEAWELLIDMGVDEIITDDPAGLINYLRTRNLRQ
jgi:glycerophosphoryl diester phosphodiesterase